MQSVCKILKSYYFCHLYLAALALFIGICGSSDLPDVASPSQCRCFSTFDSVECVVEDWSLTIEFKNCILHQSESILYE